MTIFFDMDGTIADLYAVDNWLSYLVELNSYPYQVAKPMLKFTVFARYLNKLQKRGHRIGIISWCSKAGNPDYDAEVTSAKVHWLKKHLPSVSFDEINIVPYGTPKEDFCIGADILFDDEKQNRDSWPGLAFDQTEILEILKQILKED